jgi:hypothetical protein
VVYTQTHENISANPQFTTADFAPPAGAAK